MLKFYRRWIHTAVFHSLGPVDLWTGLIASALGVLDHFLPELGLMTTYGWQIPVWAFAAVITVRLLLAPYWMWQESQKTLLVLRAAVDSNQNRAEAAAAKAEGFKTLIARGKELAREGVHSTEEYAAWDAKYDSWAEEAKEYIKNNEGHRAAGIFRRGSMMVVQRMQNAFNDDHNARLNILWEKISDLTTHYENAMDEKRIWAADK